MTFVEADENRLRQILYNISCNAMKYTEKGEIVAKVKEDSGDIVLTISDTGKGIPKEQWEQLFKDFNHDALPDWEYRQGMGLGLYISRQLARKMKGDVWISEGSVTLTATQAADTNNAAPYITLFDPTDSNVTSVEVVKYASGASTANFVTVTPAPASVISGTINRGGTGIENIGQVFSDDSIGIMMEMFSATSAENAANNIFTGSLVFDEDVSGITPISEGPGETDTTHERPKILVVKSVSGQEFSFDSIYVMDPYGREQSMTFEGFRDGEQVASIVLTMNGLGLKTFNGLSSTFENVDEIRITNNDTWDNGVYPPPHGNWAYFNSLQFGNPISSSDAGLTSIAGVAVTAGSEAGTIGEPKTASVNVANTKAELGLSDIVADADATAELYSNAGFTEGITGSSTIALTAGGATTAYIKVTAQNGTTYFFVVTAVGAGGESTYSNEVSATPRTVPGVPTNVSATAGNRQATVSFTAPANNGGSAITEYIVTSSPGNITVTGTGTTITVTGLRNGTTYTFTVKAVNEAGNGADSATSNAVTPRSPSSGGDSGGSSGGNTTPTASATPGETGVEILVNGKIENAGTATTSTEGNKTVTTITVDPQKLEQKLAAEGNNAVVTIPVNSNSDVIIGELTGQMIKNMENKGAVLEVRTEKAAYTLPAQQISIGSISEQFGAQVALQDIKVQIAISKPATEAVQIVDSSAKQGEFSIIAPPLEFNVKCTYGDKTVEVKNFNAYVKRTIAIPDGVDPSKITTGVVMDPDGTVRHVPTKVTVIDGKYYAVINSLTNSLYSVVWHPLEFKDAANHWAKEAINDMGSRMVISGVGNGMFGPMDKITREQAMTMIARAMNITGLKAKLANGEIDKLLAGFGDAAKSADYAKNGIAACVKTGIVSGKNGNLIAPKDNITRAEVVVIVQRLLQKSGLI